MKRVIAGIAILFIVAMPSLVAAQGRGNAGGAKGKPTTAQAPRPAAAQGAGAKAKGTPAGGPKATARGPKSAAAGPKTTPKGSPASANARGPKSTTPRDTKAAGRSAATSPSTTTTNTDTTTTTTASALPKNPRLVERLRALLPPGTDMDLAASGFRNQGQFVAAVHVSNNLGLAFEDVKTRMVTDGMSLGQAIQDLRPAANADAEASRATRQADDDLRTADRATKRPKS